jgi:hypothetical protein
MRGLAALVLTLAALTVVSAADAKQFVKLIAFGDGGTWTELHGTRYSPYVGVFRRVEERPTGSYLLVYPVLDRGLVAQPGRYFPGGPDCPVTKFLFVPAGSFESELVVHLYPTVTSAVAVSVPPRPVSLP